MQRQPCLLPLGDTVCAGYKDTYMYILVHFKLKYNQIISPFPFLSPALPILKLIVYFSLNMCIQFFVYMYAHISKEKYMCKYINVSLSSPESL